jgi:hypothetical protein
MLIPAILAAVIGFAFALLWRRRGLPGSWVAAVTWVLYACYEYLMYARVLCTGECNIRVDLLLFWPALLFIALAVPVRSLLRGRRPQG